MKRCLAVKPADEPREAGPHGKYCACKPMPGSAGMAPTDYPFYAGAVYANRATAPFRITPAGALVATSATITGHYNNDNSIQFNERVALAYTNLL